MFIRAWICFNRVSKKKKSDFRNISDLIYIIDLNNSGTIKFYIQATIVKIYSKDDQQE